MRKFFGTTLGAIVGLVIFLVVVAIISFGWLGLFISSEPIRQDIRPEIDEGTKSFNDGTRRDLEQAG